MKYDFKRRRAVKCEFVEKSKTSPGYLKYEVTICEKDGTIHKEGNYHYGLERGDWKWYHSNVLSS